jgi:hypothetical protein
MTTVVSRLYDQVETANRVADQLRAKGFPDSALSVVTKPNAGRIAATQVSEAMATRYAAAMTKGQALFVCRAPLTPFGAARTAMAVADSEAWIDLGDGPSNEHIVIEPNLEKHLPEIKMSKDHYLTPADYVGSGWSEWLMSNLYGWPLIAQDWKRSSSILPGTTYMSRKFWKGRLLSDSPRKSSVMEGAPLMTARFQNYPVLKPHSEKLSIMTDHPKYSERYGFKTISEKPKADAV